jgi:hypothetical protein
MGNNHTPRLVIEKVLVGLHQVLRKKLTVCGFTNKSYRICTSFVSLTNRSAVYVELYTGNKTCQRRGKTSKKI